MQRKKDEKKDENRAKAEVYQFPGGKNGKQFMQELSADILEVRRILRETRNTNSLDYVPSNTHIQEYLTELYEAVGSFQHGYGQVISQKIETDAKAIVREPVEFEDRMRRVKDAIQKVQSSIKTAENRSDLAQSWMQQIFSKIKSILQKNSKVDGLVKKLDNLQRFFQQKDNKEVKIPLRFFLPKPPEPPYPRSEAKEHEMKINKNNKS